MKVSLCIARYPYGGREHPNVTNYLLKLHSQLFHDQRISDIWSIDLDDTPITMTRNKTIEYAKQKGADYLLMIDSDMAPDLPLPDAKPFFNTSLAFALANRDRPIAIAAPYVGPPPFCNVYVFRWENLMNKQPNPDHKLGQFSRKEAESLTGIQEVAALPTGLMLLDMRAIALLKPPYFYYEWTDATESEKASTEDVTFTRDLSLAGARIYCNWDAWAGHWKSYRGDKPILPTVDQLRDKFSDALVDQLFAERIEVTEPHPGDASSCL